MRLVTETQTFRIVQGVFRAVQGSATLNQTIFWITPPRAEVSMLRIYFCRFVIIPTLLLGFGAGAAEAQVAPWAGTWATAAQSFMPGTDEVYAKQTLA